MFSFFSNKKAQKLNKLLEEGKKLPADLDVLINEIKDLKPKAAKKSFHDELKQKLLQEHKKVQLDNQPANQKTDQKSSYPKNMWAPWKIAFAAAIVVLVVFTGSYPLIPAPKVEGYSQAGRTVEIAYNAPIKVQFSQPMSKASVEENFAIEPDVKGKFDWDGNTLLFYPDVQFEKNKVYKVSVKNGARSLLQKQLQYDYMENFSIVGAPEVTLVTPDNGTADVPVTSKVTFMFDRPMIGLEPLAEYDLADLKINIEPKVKGRIKFLGTSSFQFIPEKLDYSTDYTVTLPKGLESLDGGHTEQEYVIKFSTLNPEVTSYQSEDSYFLSQSSNLNNAISYYSKHGQNPQLTIGFNQPMDLNTFKANAHLYKLKNEELKKMLPAKNDDYFVPDLKEEQLDMKNVEELAFNVDYHQFKDEDPELQSRKQLLLDEGLEEDVSKNYVNVKPQDALSLDSVYLLLLDENLKGQQGNLSMGKKVRFLLRTAEPFALSASSPTDGQKDNKESFVSLSFNNPVKKYEQDELAKLIKIAPLEEGVKVEYSLNDYDSTNIYLYNVLKPSTEYNLTISKDLEDQFGQKLPEDKILKFTTAQADPVWDIASNYAVNILNAYKPVEYFARSINVKKLDLKLKQLSESEFFSLYGNGYLDLYSHAVEGPFETAQVDLEYLFNKKEFTRLDMEKVFGRRLAPGIYYLEGSSDEVRDYQGNPQKQKIVFIVSQTALTYKHSKDSVVVWATSMNSGEPSANIKISVHDASGAVLAEGVTNSDGLFEAKITDPNSGSNYSHPDIHVIGKTDSDFAFVSNTWSDGVAAWNFNLSTSYLPEPYYSTVYTDRPIYRPGDTVSFKGIIREAGTTDLKLPSIKTTKVTVSDTLGQTVFEKDLAVSGNGTFNGELALAPKAATGNYSIQSILTSTDGQSHYVSGTFYVNEYRKPDYLVKMTPDKEDYVQGDKVKIDIDGEYFFGAKMPNAQIEWNVKSSDYYFNNYEGDAWYSFSEDGYFCYWGCAGSSDLVTQGKGSLDQNGRMTLELDADLKDKKVSQFYTIEATVFDKNNQSVSNRISIPIHQGQYYVGIANDDYVVKVGEDMENKLVAVDYDGKPLKGIDMEVSLYEREWNTVKKKNVDGGFYYENEYKDNFVASENATSDEKGEASVKFKAEKGGLFHIVVKSKDKAGNEIVAASNSYVSSGEFVYWGFDNNDRIEIVPDKQEYKVGDTAKVLIKSPFEGAYALLTYERESVREKKVIKLDSNSTTIEIPITEDFLPNMFISAAIFKGSNATGGLPELDDSENEREVAAFKVGYATLHVNTELKKMDVGLKLNKPSNQRYLPGEEVTVDISTKDVNGNPVPAEVSISVVDESVLSLTDKFVADLLNVFYRNRSLGVESAYTMTQALSRINVQIESGIKGGGGGYEAKRSTFKDTAFWKADIQTDAKGQGQVTFKLPDNLTGWEVLAVAVSKDTLLGSQRISFKTQKDVMIRPALPRFISVTDNFDAAVIVNNNTDHEVNLDVSLSAENLKIDNEKQNVTIPANNQKKVSWSVEAPKTLVAEKIKFNIGAKDSKGSDLGDQMEMEIPLKGTSFAEYVATSGSLNENITKLEKVIVPDYVDKTLSSLSIKIAPTFIGSVQSALKDLVRYPYGCAEQVTSVLLPNVKIKQMLDLPIVPDDAVNVAELDKSVNVAVQTLYSYQQAAGGWGVWQDSEQSSYLTAYVLLALNEAQKAGYTVDNAVMKNGIEYLKANMNQVSLVDNKDDALEANTRAFILYVLADLGQPDTGLSNNLFDEHKEKLSLFGKAYLAMSLKAAGVDRKADTLKEELLLVREETPRGVSFSEKTHYYSIFDTDLRSTAIVLQMLSRIDVENPVNEKIIHYLLAERKGFGWDTTQEASIIMTALLEYVKNSGEANPNFEAKVDLNKENVINEFFKADNINAVEKTINASDMDVNNEISITMGGVGKLYYDLVLQYFLPVEKIEARNEGMVIYQEYFDSNDQKEEKVINKIEAGQNVKAKMTVVVPEDRYYVSVEDFIPAGLEPIDFSLKTAQQSLQEDENNYNWWNNLWYFNHSEFRDDRVVYFADFLPKGVYEIEYYLRATTSGEFVDLPAKVQEMYVPEVFGQTTGNRFEVTPGKGN